MSYQWEYTCRNQNCKHHIYTEINIKVGGHTVVGHFTPCFALLVRVAGCDQTDNNAPRSPVTGWTSCNTWISTCSAVSMPVFHPKGITRVYLSHLLLESLYVSICLSRELHQPVPVESGAGWRLQLTATGQVAGMIVAEGIVAMRIADAVCVVVVVIYGCVVVVFHGDIDKLLNV